MGNVVRFPMNVPMTLKDRLHAAARETAPDTPAEHTDGGESPDANLLAQLNHVRDALSAAEAAGDEALRKRCLSALDAAMAVAQDMERMILRQRLHIEDMARIACTDPLTGVYNRRGFEQEFHRVLAAATRFDEHGVLVYVDLDGFKPINDTYGHAAGDAVLSEVARMLVDHVRPQDLVARIGGDEFTVLLTRTDWDNGLKRAEAIKHLLNTSYVRWNGKNIAVRASLGFQRYGSDADAELLLDKADSAMFEAKRVRDSERGHGPHTDLHEG